MSAPVFRDAEARDRPAILEIYNHYVLNAACTFDIEPYTLERRAPWFDQFSAQGPHRLLVAEEGGAVLGYANSMRHRAKAAYDRTVETSIYLHPDWRGRGIAAPLYGALLEAAAAGGAHLAVAGVSLPNPASVALHRALGFEEVGTFPEIGYKFGRYWDTFWMRKLL
ncbi:MAG: GNAT family N-acetyltransferase [Parvularculaceae bacterium]